MPANASIASPQRCAFVFIFLGLVLLLVTILSAWIGTVPISLEVFLKSFENSPNADPIFRQIVIDFRLPRILTAILAGAALATAGLIMQTIFRNPLADPFVLGINSGASLGVAIILLVLVPTGTSLTAGLDISGQVLLILASSGGAAITLFTVLALARRVDITSVLIIGLMISYTVGALVSILMYSSMAERLQSFLSWSFGDYGSVSWKHMRAFAPTIISALGVSLLFIKPLDALQLGEYYAESIGTRTKRVRIIILFVASILAGTVTGFCGPIGFLGIAAPHLSRYLFQTGSHRVLIPASILVGALLSLSSDFIARGPGLGITLPLNAITALVGAPIIITVLIKQRNLKRIFG